MPDWLRKLVVYSIAGAFIIISSGGWQPCMAISQAAAAPIASNHDHNSYGYGLLIAVDHDCDHNQRAGAAALPANPDQPKSSSHDHPCLNCCGMCAPAILAAHYSAEFSVFSAEAIVFFIATHDLTGRIMSLDPGIPKRIV